MQRRLTSFIESCLNVGSGFVISTLVWWLVICPLYGIPYRFSENVGITAIFTAISVIRGFIWRRIFDAKN